MKEDVSGRVRLVNKIKELHATGKLDGIECSHLLEIKDVIPSASGCEDCLKTGDNWVFLRLCLECGHVGCCDNSKNKHATRHFHETHHPMIVSFEIGEEWIYCYSDDVAINL